MKQYTIIDPRNRQVEVFDTATIEPVLLTEEARPSHFSEHVA